MSILFFTLPVTRTDRWGTTDDFATSSLHVFLFSTALWELRSPALSTLSCCLPSTSSVSPPPPPSWYLVRWFFARPDDRMTWSYHFNLRFLTVTRSLLCIIRWFVGSGCGPLRWQHVLCMRCARPPESTSFQWLVSYSVDLLRGSMFHKHTDRWTVQGSGSAN